MTLLITMQFCPAMSPGATHPTRENRAKAKTLLAAGQTAHDSLFLKGTWAQVPAAFSGGPVEGSRPQLWQRRSRAEAGF